jgi:3'(2'), 5'-bisphosphate nucleotidase
MEWDTAAAHAVVNAAGGIVCNMIGEELHYNKADLHNPEFLVLSATDKALFSLLKFGHHGNLVIH